MFDGMMDDYPECESCHSVPTESNQKEPLDLHAMHTLYSGCTAEEKCQLIERMWEPEEMVRNRR